MNMRNDYENCEFSTLLGKVLVSVIPQRESLDEDIRALVFTTSEGEVFVQWHDQDCCEWVILEDIVGDLEDLLGEPILEAEEVSYSEEKELPTTERVRLRIVGRPGTQVQGLSSSYKPDSETWTFYKLRTRKGGVTLRWYGESNGYYSESVDFAQVSDTGIEIDW